MEDYLKTKIITSHFMMDCMMAVYDMMNKVSNGGSRDCRDLNKLNALLTSERSEREKAQIEVQIYTVKIQEKVKEFESKVWFKGLQDQVLATNERGISAKLGKKYNNFCVLTWTGMGRTMITIEDDEASVTCVADETSKESRTGFHGIRATGEQAIALYDKAIVLYENGTLKFKLDKKVSLF